MFIVEDADTDMTYYTRDGTFSFDDDAIWSPEMA
jgi:flagellar hook protein FlgE